MLQLMADALPDDLNLGFEQCYILMKPHSGNVSKAQLGSGLFVASCRIMS